MKDHALLKRIRETCGRGAVMAIAASGVIGCGETRFDDAEWATRGAEILRPFKERLQGALKQGLTDGPEQAIETCRVQAPGLAAASGAEGVKVGRTSHRLRNPANAPAPWMRPLLEAYRTAPGPLDARVVRLDDGRIGYVEPIYVQTLCLVCHGDVPAPAVRRRLTALYPNDQATGFRDGDFRGMFWVEFDAGRPNEDSR